VDYARSVNEGGTTGGGIGDFSEVTRVGLTLSEVKAFDVAVGEVVRSVGKVSATDGLGADWLAISATGTPGDDVELIDFDNGLQGTRNESFAYGHKSRNAGQTIFDDPQVIVDVGATGVATYRNTFASVDLSSVVPSEASSAKVRVYAYAKYPNATTAARLALQGWARKTGSTLTNSSDAEIIVGLDYQVSSSNAELESSFVGEFDIALTPGSSPNFDFQLRIQDPFIGSGGATYLSLIISVISYNVKYANAEA